MKYTIKYQKEEITIIAEAENEEERKQVVNGIKFIIKDLNNDTKQPVSDTKEESQYSNTTARKIVENEAVSEIENPNEKFINGFLYHKCFAKTDGHEFWALVNPDDVKMGAIRFYNANQVK